MNVCLVDAILVCQGFDDFSRLGVAGFVFADELIEHISIFLPSILNNSISFSFLGRSLGFLEPWFFCSSNLLTNQKVQSKSFFALEAKMAQKSVEDWEKIIFLAWRDGLPKQAQTRDDKQSGQSHPLANWFVDDGNIWKQVHLAFYTNRFGYVLSGIWAQFARFPLA